MKTIDKHEGLRTPFGIVSTEDLMLMMNPIRERDNKIAELDAEVKRLRDFIQSVWDGLGEAGRNEYYKLFKEYMGEEEE